MIYRQAEGFFSFLILPFLSRKKHFSTSRGTILSLYVLWKGGRKENDRIPRREKKVIKFWGFLNTSLTPFSHFFLLSTFRIPGNKILYIYVAKGKMFFFRIKLLSQVNCKVLVFMTGVGSSSTAPPILIGLAPLKIASLLFLNLISERRAFFFLDLLAAVWENTDHARPPRRIFTAKRKMAKC